MNKKLNTALFLVGATLANLLMIVIFFVVGILIINGVLHNYVNNAVNGSLVLVDIIGSVLLSYFLYNFIMGKIIEKVDMDKYFDPIFKKRKARARDRE